MLSQQKKVSCLEDEALSQQKKVSCLEDEVSCLEDEVLSQQKKVSGLEDELRFVREQIRSQAIRVNAVCAQNSRLLEQIDRQQWQELSILKLKGRAVANLTEKKYITYVTGGTSIKYLGDLSSTDFRLDANFPDLVRAVNFLKAQGNESAHPQNFSPSELEIQFRTHGDDQSANCVAVCVSFLDISKRKHNK